MSCPCGNTAELADCCEPYVKGERPAPTAEALMRSRYSSYSMEAVEYIAESHLPETRDEVDQEAAKQWAEQAEWMGLDILDTVDGQEGDSEGIVEFRAKFKLQGVDQVHHERSTFKKVEDKWYYVDGEMVKAKPIVREGAKVGRNEPCPCGSGKKFKRCCG